jgi:hypothetical protein
MTSVVLLIEIFWYPALGTSTELFTNSRTITGMKYYMKYRHDAEELFWVAAFAAASNLLAPWERLESIPKLP